MQTEELEDDDTPLTDPETGITVYATDFTAQFFQDLEITPSRILDDGTLLIRDRPY